MHGSGVSILDVQKNGNLTRLHPCKPFVLSSGLLLGKSLYLIRIKYKKKTSFTLLCGLVHYCEKLLLRVLLGKSLDLIRIKCDKKTHLSPFCAN